MWRSEPFSSTIVFNKSGNVAMANPSLDRFANDFLDRGEAFLDLAQTAHAQRQHAFLDRLAPQFQAGRADQNQLAELVRDRHHLVEADAALVAGLVAALAAGALHRRDGIGVFL